MLLKDARTPKSLSKSQASSLEKEIKSGILELFTLTKNNASQQDKRALLIPIFDTLQEYLGHRITTEPHKTNYHVVTNKTYTIISELNIDLKTPLVTSVGLGIQDMVILSTSTVLEAFEEVMGYLTQFKPQLTPTGNIYYLVPLDSKSEDFTLYRFNLGVLAEQYRTLTNAHLI